ncbi:class I SAM-dependent methyltransferase [Agrobacterium sp. LAD9]|uniref:methyltransferase n=1 Tax=Agrobacterium sp. LAD9 TaxID=2055153 RepID=UPI000D1E5D1F|nr:class I SAM-dependent methyltransferase [Agrobacterium sp. LAD9]
MIDLDRIRATLEASQQCTFPLSMREFGLDLTVHEGVFPPENFQSWRWLTENFPPMDDKTILEIGCGFGLPGLYLAKNGARSLVACDVNPKAVANTLENAARNGITNIEVVESDIFSSIPACRKFDIIFWNYPSNFAPAEYEYVHPLERGAIDPGYSLLRRFLSEGPQFLADAGCILLGFGTNARDDLLKEIVSVNALTSELLASGSYAHVNVTYRLFSIRKEAAQ